MKALFLNWAYLKAGQLPEVKTVFEQQNAIELAPAAYMRRKACNRGLEPLGSEMQRESFWVSMSDLLTPTPRLEKAAQ